MDIESAPGVGTTVTVWLPVTQGEVPTEEVPQADQWAAGKVLTGRALLVEDEDQLRDLAARSRRPASRWRPPPTPRPAAAVAEREGPFDVLITDVMLPGGSGFELARALGAGRQGFPALFVTAYTNHSVRRQSRAPTPRSCASRTALRSWSSRWPPYLAAKHSKQSQPGGASGLEAVAHSAYGGDPAGMLGVVSTLWRTRRTCSVTVASSCHPD